MTMTLISTVTVGAGGAANINFTSIPQTGTDLYLVISARADTSFSSFYVQYNNDGRTIYSLKRLYGSGDSLGTDSQSGFAFHRIDTGMNGTDSTANTFFNGQISIPNYTLATPKSTSFNTVTETNATAGVRTVIAAGFFNATSAITSLLIDSDGNFVQNTTASLYTISNTGASGATVA